MKTVTLNKAYSNGVRTFEAGTHELSEADAERAARFGAVKADKPVQNKADKPVRNKAIKTEKNK